MRTFAPGEHIEFREVWSGHLWERRPAIVVQDGPDLIALYTPPRQPTETPVHPDGTRARLPLGEWHLNQVLASERAVLGLHAPGTDHSVLLVWETDGSLRHWYINLESDLQRTDSGFECADHVLDIVVVPDLSSWRWKDEDELAQAVKAGLFTRGQAAGFRAEGERATRWLRERRPPYDRPWEDWRLPAEWALPHQAGRRR